MNRSDAIRGLVDRRQLCILNKNPAVLASFENDFGKNADALAEFAVANPGTTFLLQLGGEHETPEAADRLAASVAQFREKAPGARVVALCNAAAELDMLGRRGVETRWVHQNSFLDERRYRVFPGIERPYDAVYLARITPFKRHGLVPEVLGPRLLFLGSYSSRTEAPYADGIRARYPGARWMGYVPGGRIPLWLARAKCGLILSAAEGACFASSEYLLCGLPVVDTPALGGRDVLYPPEFVRSADPDPDAIAEAIAHWAAHPPAPRDVRRAWLDKAAPHRKAYRELMRELTGRVPPRPPHKLGLRTPHPGLARTMAIRAFLLLKGLFLK